MRFVHCAHHHILNLSNYQNLFKNKNKNNSLDVKNLYTSIPKLNVLRIFENKIQINKY